MSSSKKFTCKGDFAACVYLAEDQNLIPPPFHTVYDTYLHREVEGELNQREGERGNLQGRVQITSWVENTNMTECTQEICFLYSLNSDKHLPQCPFTGQFFR
jgi:hypothetical protein